MKIAQMYNNSGMRLGLVYYNNGDAIFKRFADNEWQNGTFVVAKNVEFDGENCHWSQGVYDFKNFENAMKFMKVGR